MDENSPSPVQYTTSNIEGSSVTSSATSQPVPAQQSPRKKSKLVYLFIGLIILVVLTFVASIILNLYKTSTFKPVPVAQKPIPSLSRKTSPPPTTDPTANWKTYTNKTYGWKIKYPNTWLIVSMKPSAVGDGEATCTTDNQTPNDREFVGLSTSTVNSLCSGANTDISMGGAVYDSNHLILNQLSRNTSSTTIYLAGIQAKKFVNKVSGIPPQILIYLDNNGAIYEISLQAKDDTGNYNPTYDQILSTLKFTD